MTRYQIVLSALIVAAPAMAGAQHEAHQAAPVAASGASVAQCVQAQAVVAKTIDAATSRLEAARQTNSAAAMRAAVDDLAGMLRDMRAQLAPCGQMQAADGDHAGHASPTAGSPATSPAGADKTPAK